jgi:hypothetical protein
MKIGGGDGGKLGGTVLEFERAGLPRGLGGSFSRLIYGRGRFGNFWTLIQLNNARIGDFPTEGLYTALLLVAFFQEDGFSRVGGQIASCGKDNVSGAVSYHDSTS